MTQLLCPFFQSKPTNNFSVTYQGQPVTGDLSSAEIQIWNQGKQAIHGGDRIHGGDILQAITLKTTNGAAIYTATMSTTRDVVGVSLNNSSNLPLGIMPIDFKILEHNDGIKVQLIYGGSVNMPLVLDGIIEGQKRITQFPSDEDTHSQLLETIFISFGLASLTMIVYLARIRNNTSPKSLIRNMQFYLFILIGATLIFTGMFAGWQFGHILKPKPPFGF
jgi:hypothetical protein